MIAGFARVRLQELRTERGHIKRSLAYFTRKHAEDKISLLEGALEDIEAEILKLQGRLDV